MEREAHLNHDIIRVDRVADLVDPAFDDLGALFHEMKRGHKRGTRHTRHLVYNGLLHVALNALQHCVVGDAAQGSDGGPAVQVLLAGHVFGERAGHDDHVVGNRRHLLDTQVEYAAKHYVLALEQLGHGEKGRCGFGGRQLFALYNILLNNFGVSFIEIKYCLLD